MRVGENVTYTPQTIWSYSGHPVVDIGGQEYAVSKQTHTVDKEALNKQLEQQQIAYVNAKARGDKQGMEQAAKNGAELRANGADLQVSDEAATLQKYYEHSGVNLTISNHSVEDLNKGIVQAKNDYAWAKAHNDQAGMAAAAQVATNLRAMGGTIGSDVSLVDAQKMVNQPAQQSSAPNTSTSNSYATDSIKALVPATTQSPVRYGGYSLKTQHIGSSVLEIRDDTVGRIKKGEPVGDWAVRIDQPHQSADYNHINTNEDIYPNNSLVKSLNHKPISETTFNIAKNAGVIGKGVKAGGGVLGGIGVAMDASDIYSAYEADGNKVGTNTVKTTTTAVGGWAGGYLGAESGAVLGAEAGTAVLPGLGTAIGGFGGGIVGGILGSIGGEKITE